MVPKTDAKPARKKRFATRTRQGCLTCRSRRKRCDETMPKCNNCSRLNLKCVFESPRHARIPPSAQKAPSSPPANSAVALAAPLSLLPKSELCQGRAEQQLLHYYISHVSRLLPMYDAPENDYRSVFLPMAFDEPVVYHGLVNLASRQCSDIPCERHLIYENKALRLLSQTFANAEQCYTPTTLASILLFCATEVASGDTEKWYLHLKAAKHIIHALDEKYASSMSVKSYFGRDWLLRMFAYHDVLGSVTLGTVPLIEGVYWEKPKPGEPDPLIGVTHDLLTQVARISVLRSNISSMTVSEVAQTAHSIKLALSAWAPDPRDPAELNVVGTAHQSAALLYLFRVLQRGQKPHSVSGNSLISDCQEEIEKIFEASDDVPYQSVCESGLVFPLFMAIGQSTNTAMKSKLMLRLKSIWEFRRLDYILRAIDILEDCQANDMSWETIIAQRNVKIVL